MHFLFVNYHSGALKELKEALCHLSLEILELVTKGLGMNMNNFDMYQREIQGLIRSNFYHQIDSHDEKEQVLGLKPHMDGSFISLLLQDDVAGLEIMKDGNWFCVKPKENAICIIIGDVLEVIHYSQFLDMLHVPKLAFYSIIKHDHIVSENSLLAYACVIFFSTCGWVFSTYKTKDVMGCVGNYVVMDYVVME
jgi:hypothetical protein